MHYNILSVLALASMAAAVPTPETIQQRDDQYNRVIDPWGVYGHPGNSKRSDIEILDARDINSTSIRIAERDYSPAELLDLAKRASIADFKGKVPGCPADGDDPSNKNTPKPTWAVNQGVKIPKSGDDDECTTGHNADHCWTEYYLVEAAVEYFSWQQTGSAVNCPADSKGSCSSSVSSLQQSCTTTGTSKSDGHDWKTIDAAGKLDIEVEKWGLKGSGGLTIGGSYTKTHSETNTKLTQVCSVSSSSATCTWSGDDASGKDLCHQVWFADRVLHVWGQAQRTCNKCSGDGVQQNTGDGKVCVRGQMEFDFRLPINKLVHCDGKCNSNDPGLNQPPNSPRAPYKQPNNWDDLVVGN